MQVAVSILSPWKQDEKEDDYARGHEGRINKRHFNHTCEHPYSDAGVPEEFESGPDLILQFVLDSREAK